MIPMPNRIQCIIVDDEPVAREILESHLSKIDTIDVVANCKNALEAFQAVNTYPVDLIFLDINMPDISGLTFAKAVSKEVKVIFTTAYREYAIDGFDLQAVDYLLKPISFPRLFQSISKYIGENQKTEVLSSKEIEDKPDSIFVRSDRKMIRINFDEILYIESLSDYIKIHLNEKLVLTRETITSIEANLPKNDFLRVHRSFIVAVGKIESYTNEIIELGQKDIPISRSYRQQVMEFLDQ